MGVWLPGRGEMRRETSVKYHLDCKSSPNCWRSKTWRVQGEPRLVAEVEATETCGDVTGTNSFQKVQADYHGLPHDFRRAIITLQHVHDIEPSRIVNMDQTMCKFDMPPNHTNNKKGAKSVRIKTTRAEKKGLTVALATTAAEEKLLAVIILRSVSEQGFREALSFLPNDRL